MFSTIFNLSRKDLTLKGCKVDVILITGMLSPYASMVEKLHRDIEKERVTMLKIERAGDVLADAVSIKCLYAHKYCKYMYVVFDFFITFSLPRLLNPYYYFARVRDC